MKSSNKKAVSLIAAIGIMLIISVLSAVMASMLGVTSRGALDYLRSSQAFSIAQGGLNWYMKQLADTVNWTTTTNQTNVSLGSGTFDVALSNKASPYTDSITNTRMDISVTGKITGTDNVTIQRVMSQRVFKFPSACKFALFWGRRTGTTLTLTTTTINGDYWSIGTTAIPAGSSVTKGNAYRPGTEDITGAGTYTEVNVGAFPYFSNFTGSTSTFSTPAINSTYYTNLISTYNTLEDACTTAVDTNQAANLVLTGNTVCCRDFNTNGNITISGNGFIIANRDILLHTDNADAGTLTITPSGGNIVFIAGRNITINSGQADTAVIGNLRSDNSQPGIRFYCRSQASTTALMTVRNDTTDITGALVLADRRIIVQTSADFYNSTFFVNYPGSTTNNYLQITGAGTTVGTIAAPCGLISVARLTGTPSALTIDASAAVTGLLYQYDTANSGSTRLNTATITGSIIANQLQGNAITGCTIIYDPTVMPDPPVEGFDGFAAKKANSWSGN